MDNALFARYSAMEMMFKKVEAARDMARKELVEEMQKNHMSRADTDYGIFTVASRSTWKYSDKITKMEEKIKEAKIKEQQKGSAKESTTNFLVFKQKDL